MARPAIGVSSCLLGFCVRFDGKSKYNPEIALGLKSSNTLVPICPEHESGMPVPREPMDLFEVSGEIRLLTVNTRMDLTGVLVNWVEKRLSEIEGSGLRGFIMKSGSPSCGICSARIHRGGELFRNGTGIFAEALRRRYPGIPLVQDTDLNTPEKISSFIELTGGRCAES